VEVEERERCSNLALGRSSLKIGMTTKLAGNGDRLAGGGGSLCSVFCAVGFSHNKHTFSQIHLPKTVCYTTSIAVLF
jgi:hypothetical protein